MKYPPFFIVFQKGDIMPVINRKCNYCGNEYYICRSCIKIGNAWKNVCCSRECFMELMKEQDIVQPIKIDSKESTMKKVLLRAELKSGKTTDIVGYDVDLGKFDCSNDKTITYNDVKTFYVPSEELKEMISKIKSDTKNKVETIAKKTSKKTDADTGSQMDSKTTDKKDDKTIEDSSVKPVDGTVK